MIANACGERYLDGINGGGRKERVPLFVTAWFRSTASHRCAETDVTMTMFKRDKNDYQRSEERMTMKKV